MKKLYTIGEMLIDFTANKIGSLKEVKEFVKNPGGAPANVAVCTAKLGGNAAVITKLGKDAFGDFLIDILKENRVDTSFVFQTNEANTALAFVALDEKGEREFMFYRKPSADLFLNEDEIPEVFQSGDILHFGSVDLVNYPVRTAHLHAIYLARKAGTIISFDPNLRYSLWETKNELLSTVRNFIPLVDMIKVSEEELFDITEIKEEKEAVNRLFHGNVKLILLTKGEKGSSAYTKKGYFCTVPSQKVIQVDATGAGDCFIGTFLFQILRDNKIDVSSLEEHLQTYLFYANKAASIAVTKKGAIPSIPDEMTVFKK